MSNETFPPNDTAAAQPASAPGSRPPRTRVALVFGGRSSEHGVSVVTAASVLAAIDRTRYEVVPIGINASGRWTLVADEPARMAITDGRMPDVDGVAEPGDGTVVLMGESAADGGRRHEIVRAEPGALPKALGEVDVVFPLLHGPYGEDGTIQGLLEMAGVPYVGCGVLASAVGMDKEYMKHVFTACGLPVGPYTVIRPREWERDREAVRRRVAELGWPVFVKPARAGSSMGISKVNGPEELDAAVEEARGHDPKVIVEAMLRGREIECGVLEFEDGPRASLPAEIEVLDGAGHEFYDFEAKYLQADEATRARIPAELDAEQTARIRDIAVRAFEALSCEGLARVDCFLLEDGRFVVNEINTMPGFTPTSMYPLMWRATGVEYPELIDRLIQAALRRGDGLLR
ncbi:D-alanine--D-alanine ligase family protein [Allostreptomyces psammosilenae]|uniref:D-alanine--D-alanine ligase n=1 Tax=Allostreptomyces psammosilenae TaxID=1892865 RepID=A0A853A815_9ACTN|nr:D-alanine--D-alanine ligase family protein [Allostreptomyces psammosilenae]NYI06582.1 D-alanine-D-alanine ligase [Allostreptomyces psammosilenae]